jgi:hypothetical protein
VIRKPADFSPPIGFPTGEAGKNIQTGFLVDLGPATGFLQKSAVCHHRNSGGQMIKLFLYSECEFFKNHSF